MTAANATGQDKQTRAVRSVGRRLLKRTLTTLPVLWLVVSVVFLLIHLVPGDPIVQMLGEGATASDIDALRHSYGLDAPLSQQYTHYWHGILHADLGQSLRLHDSVTHLILQRYPYTLALTIAALLIGIATAVPAGIWSALHRNRWQDRTLGVVSLVGLSFPNFALGPILILLFSIQLGWLPVSGAGLGAPGLSGAGLSGALSGAVSGATDFLLH